MISIAIVEDDMKCMYQLSGYVKQYAQKNNEKIDIRMFSDGDDIIYEYKAVYDIIFMDIQMKIMDVTVIGDMLQISHPRKKAFMDELTDYVGGEVI
ncbi:MAG TPA: hypothetical protein VN258_08930 [Mobilitalea sp.]|nr:hypothetical protein [Mobilitalea sp.]